MKYLKQVAKSVYAFLVAGLGALATVMVGDIGFSDITDGQWLSAVLVALVAGGGVYGIKNAEE